jgi:hypothetical protein
MLLVGVFVVITALCFAYEYRGEFTDHTLLRRDGVQLFLLLLQRTCATIGFLTGWDLSFVHLLCAVQTVVEVACLVAALDRNTTLVRLLEVIRTLYSVGILVAAVDHSVAACVFFSAAFGLCLLENMYTHRLTWVPMVLP